MVQRPASRRAQRGAALLALLAVAVMVFAYVLASRLNAASRFVGVDRDTNAQVLSQAKQALIGWMAINAAGTDSDPGRLPCPEAPGDFGTANEGRAAGNCTLPAVGRLPWRTLGLDKLADAAGEPLWYVVSTGWALSCSTCNTMINADSPGQLSLDGGPADAVALIIAPGPAIRDGCSAFNQSRPIAGPPNVANYLECGNATGSYVSSSPGNTFNDQVVRIAVADVMPAIEAAIQERMQREIAPAVRSAAFELDSSLPQRLWISTAPLASSNALIYPYPVPFTTPTTSVSNFRGVVGTNQGLMPFASAASAVAFASVPPDVIKISTTGVLKLPVNCGWVSVNDVYGCEGEYEEDADPTQDVILRMTATFTNAAMGFRARNTAVLTAEARNGSTDPWTTTGMSTSKRLELNDGASVGSVTVQLDATLPNVDAMGWGHKAQFRLRINRAVVADHPLVSDTARALRFSGGSSAINSGNTVTGATSGASGAVQVVVDSGTWLGGNAAGVLFFSTVSGTFQSGETLQVSGSPRALSAGTDFDIGWFARNEWYRNVYYAVAAPNLPGALPSVSGCSSTNCLSINDPATQNIRALLILAGRRLDTQTRPNATLSNYLEHQNANLDVFYEQRPVRSGKVVDPTLNAPWNDRVVLADWIAPNPTFPLAYLP